ncbi:hypothetical protein ACSQ67_003348 [Phaseolus vulgaris]
MFCAPYAHHRTLSQTAHTTAPSHYNVVVVRTTSPSSTLHYLTIVTIQLRLCIFVVNVSHTFVAGLSL